MIKECLIYNKDIIKDSFILLNTGSITSVMAVKVDVDGVEMTYARHLEINGVCSGGSCTKIRKYGRCKRTVYENILFWTKENCEIVYDRIDMRKLSIYECEYNISKIQKYLNHDERALFEPSKNGLYKYVGSVDVFSQILPQKITRILRIVELE